jgi:hypothetical protein
MNNNDHSRQVRHELVLHANNKGSLYLLCKVETAIIQAFQFHLKYFFLVLLMISNNFELFQ